MNDITSVLLSKEFLIVYGMIALMIAMVIIAFLTDRKSNKKVIVEEIVANNANDNNMETITTLEDKSKEITQIDELLETTEINTVDQTEEQSSEKEQIKYVDETLEKTQAQLELQRLTEELKKQEEQPTNIELTNFEQEQEESAIISLDELMKKADTLYEQNEVVQYEDEGNEPINLAELEERIKEQEKSKEVIKLDDFNTVINTEEKETPKKFKSSPVLSPVYGNIEQEISKETSLELENTANYDKLDEEIRKTNEFLQILKELQKKLD